MDVYEALRYQTICACKEAGVEFRGEHVFRHTFATNCYHKGVNVKILSRLLGHADVNITYGHTTEQMHQEAAERFQASISERLSSQSF